MNNVHIIEAQSKPFIGHQSLNETIKGVGCGHLEIREEQYLHAVRMSEGSATKDRI
jgi:hypothetical protein